MVDKFKRESNKELLKLLYEQHFTLFKESAPERGELHDIEYSQREEEFSILGEMEIYSDSVIGPTLRVIERDEINIEQEIIEKVEKTRIFNYPEFMSWYKSNNKKFKKICQYLELIDYMRLLLLEYLT